jgi:hypothetical protein
MKKPLCRLLTKIQKRGEKNRSVGDGRDRPCLLVRCSEVIERNEAYGVFFSGVLVHGNGKRT